MSDFGEGKYTEIDSLTNDEIFSYFFNFILLFIALRGTPMYFAPELCQIY